MKNYRLLTLLFCSFCAVSACSDDDDEATPSKEQMLMGGKQWQVTAATASYSGVPIYSYANAEDCEKDNFIEFRNNQVLIADEGPTKCDPSDPQQESTTWAIAGDTLTLNGGAFGFPGSEVDFVINSLTNTNLELTFADDSFGPLTGKISMRVK